MNIVLFGFKSSGKTFLGKLLSLDLKCAFIDTDDLIISLYQEHYGKLLSIGEIHQILQETGFRDLERRALRTLTSSSHAVIALGGGAVLDSDNVSYLQKIGRLVYLKASLATIEKRILRSKLPSFIQAEDPRKSLQRIYDERLPIYASISAPCIHVDLMDEARCLQELRTIFHAEKSFHGF